MTSSFRLARISRFALRLAVSCDARCARSTSASQHIHYEHLRLVGFCFVVGDFRHPRDRRECSVSRRCQSLRRTRCSSPWGVLFPVARRWIVPLTPLSRSMSTRMALSHASGFVRSAKTVSAAVPVKRHRLSRSEVPSLGRWRNPHACRNSFPNSDRLIVAFRRSRDFAATARSSSRFRPYSTCFIVAFGDSKVSRIRARPRLRSSIFG